MIYEDSIKQAGNGVQKYTNAIIINLKMNFYSSRIHEQPEKYVLEKPTN